MARVLGGTPQEALDSPKEVKARVRASLKKAQQLVAPKVPLAKTKFAEKQILVGTKDAVDWDF